MEQAETIIACTNNPPFTSREIKEISSLDFTPSVRTNFEIYEVKIVCFNDWKGFQNVYYTFSYPSLALRIRKETLVKYSCNILF